MKTYAAFLLLFVSLTFFDLATSNIALRRKFKKLEVESDSLRGDPYPEDQWLDQRVDHFNVADVRTWKQKFYMNDAFYKPGGPVFLNIGGEGADSPIWMVDGSWIQDAKKFGAMLFSLEHRYYGKSHPTEDMSVDNLAYLSSEQALEDLAYFIEYQKAATDLKDNPWIVFGGSYSGSLAAWFRMKYPHLAVGAVATSAPLFAELDFIEYLEVVRDSLATTGPVCDEAIAEGMKQIEEAMKSEEGVKQLNQKFKLCTPLDVKNEDDVTSFYELVADNFMGVVQYNKDNRNFTGSSTTSDITIDVVCAAMAKEEKSALDRLAEVNDILLEAYEEECVDFTYQAFLDTYTQTSWESSASAGGRQWFYQTCTEFGWYQSTDLKDQPFKHVPIEFLVKQCKDIYGDKFTKEFVEEGIARTNRKYGGYGITVTNTVFPNGSIDPWHPLSVLKDLSETAKAIFIEGTAHCANMYPASPEDPPQLVEARKQITEAIASWIQ